MENAETVDFWLEKSMDYASEEKYEEALAAVRRGRKIEPKNSDCWGNEALLLLQMKKYVKAILAIRKALQLNDQDADLWRISGDIYSSIGITSRALKDYSKALALKPDDEDAYLGLVMCHVAARNEEEVIRALESAWQAMPDNEHMFSLFMNFCFKYERLETAAENARKLIERNPGNHAGWYYISLASAQSGDVDSALEAMQSALELDSGNKRAWGDLAGLYVRRGDFKKALEAADRATELDPGNPSLWDLKSRLHQRHEEYDEAAAARQRAIALEPGNALHHADMANLHLMTGNFGNAIDSGERAVGLDPENAATWSMLTAAYTAGSRYLDAIKAAKTAISLGGHETSLWSNMSFSFREIGDSERAKKYAQHVIDSAPGKATGWRDMGHCFSSQRNYDRAIEYYQEAAALEPLNTRIGHDLASAYILNDLGGEAAGILQAIIDEGRADTETYHLLFKACVRERKDEQAVAAINKAIELDPANASGYYELSKYFYYSERYAEAKEAALRGLDICPEEAVLWHRLFHACSMLEELEEALAAERKALEISPGNNVHMSNIAHTCGRLKRFSEAVELGDAAKENIIRSVRKDFHRSAAGQDDDLPAIIGATVDLKTPGGRIQILEFNNLLHSGFKGFRRVTGLDMRKDIIFPHYRRLEKGWLTEEGWRPRILREEHDKVSVLADIAASLAGSENIQVNSDIGFLSAIDNKDLTTLTVPEEAGRFFPRTIVVPRSEAGLAAATDILGDTFGSDPETRVIIKPCASLQGNGVEVARLADLPGRLGEIIHGTGNDGDEHFRWRDDTHPNLLVQECVHSDPVQAEDGRMYDGTMRVAFTALIYPGFEDDPEILFHGAYWKLPSEPIGSDNEQGATVSMAPTKIKNDSVIFAAPVTDELRESVESQLQTCLRAWIPAAVAGPEPFAERLAEMLDSEDEVLQGIGICLATDFTTGHLLELNSDHEPGKKGHFQEVLFRKFNRIAAADPASAPARYLQQVTTVVQPENMTEQLYDLHYRTALFVEEFTAWREAHREAAPEPAF